MLAVFSDVHANAAALQAALEDAVARGAKRVVCLGDIVGYNALPMETIELLRSVRATSILGNHDLMALGRLEPERCGPNARRAILWTREALAPAARGYLEELPESRTVDDRILLLHSALGDPVVYLRTPGQFLAQYSAIRSAHPSVSVCLTGHTHTGRVVEVRRGVTARLLGRRRIRLRPDRFYFINPGSVGHPRREDYRASYALLEPRAGRLRFRKVAYARARVDAANLAADIHTDLGPSPLAFRWRMARHFLRGLRHRLGPRRP